MTAERMTWQFAVPGKAEYVTLEHGGVTQEQAAAYLIGQGAIPSRECACCGAAVPINGVRARLVRTFGGYVDGSDGGEARYVPASMVEGEWRAWPLARQKGGN